MLPAHQRLGARDAGAVDLCLVVKQELTFFDCIAQPRLQCRPLHHHRLHVRIEETHRVAAFFLGLVHRKVRLLQEFVNRRLMSPEHGGAHARGTAVFNVTELIRTPQDGEDLFAQGFGLTGRLLAVFVQASQHHHELVAPHPRHRVALEYARRQTLRHLLQQQVAFVVTQGIVQRLEVIQVDKQQGAARFTAGAGRDRLLQPVEQQGPVRQVRQRVEERQLLDPLFRDLALGNVVMRADIVTDDPILAHHRGDSEPFGVDVAILAAVPDFPLPAAVAVDRFPHLAKEARVVAA